MVQVVKVGTHLNGYTHIYVGRPSSYKPSFGLDASFLGNPFPMKEEDDRDDVCISYESWFYGIVNHNTRIKEGMERLRTRVRAGENIALVCFCAPKRCHADTIKKYLES